MIVFSASSMAPAIEELAKVFDQNLDFKVRVTPASSSTLARQIENGAPAHIFISANKAWYQYLLQKNLLETPATIIAKNQLVLAAFSDYDPRDKSSLGDFLSTPFKGRLIVGELDATPLGIYTGEALKSLRLWDSVSSKLAPARNARSALGFIEHKAANLAILYKSDAVTSDRVKILASFPSGSHSPIEYQAALTLRNHTQADIFLKFITSSQGRDILKKHGLTVEE